ncbi:MAG: F0F1 ATP synthase subunit B, partial [Clostridia bacterium]|nr:F0F1 ATP synthase subunit B [Clostridia bacterium]
MDMESLNIISVNIWQILISLCNLLIIFLIVKRFLFKPVRRVLSERQEKIQADYDAAKEANEQAQASKEEWERTLSGAQARADEIIKTATTNATRRSEALLALSKEKAEHIVRRAEEDAAREHKKAQSQIKHEIADVSVLLTQKMLD